MAKMRLLLRVLAAGVGTLAIAVLAIALAFVGQGQYLEDHCITRAPIPDEGSAVRGPIWEFPATLRCEWTGLPDVVVQDWLPLLWVAGCLAGGLAAIVLLWWVLLVRLRRAGHATR